MPARMRLLVNLPPGFFSLPLISPILASLDEFADVTQTSCNTADEIRPHLRQSDAVLMWSWPELTPDLLDECPGLRFCAHLDISQRGARTLLERGIPVSVARSAFSPAVAEMALTLILSCLRRSPSHQAAMWQNVETWVERFPDDIDANERQLSGRAVGLIGFGGIGRRLAELLAPFGCPLRVFDPYVGADVLARFGAKAVTLDEMAREVEVLVLCAASNPGTKALLRAEHINALQPGAVLVNVSRAALVDGEALLARLKRGDIFAALDVFDLEPLPADSELRKLPNAYLTPHRAGGILESVERLLRYLSEDLRAFHAAKPLSHALTAEMLPALDA